MIYLAFVICVIIGVIVYLWITPSSEAAAPTTAPAPVVVKAPERKCNHVDNIRLIGGGFYGKSEADHAKNYRAAMDLPTCQKNCLDDPACKQYVWYKGGNCYSMVNEYGIRPESLDKNFASGYCGTHDRFPPTKL